MASSSTWLRFGLCVVASTFVGAADVPARAANALFALDGVNNAIERVDPSIQTLASLPAERTYAGLTTWPPGSRHLLTSSWVETPGSGFLEVCFEGQHFDRIDAETGAVESLPALDPVALGLPSGTQLVPETFAVSPLEADVAVVVGILVPTGCATLDPDPVFELFFVDLATGAAARPAVPLSPHEALYYPSSLVFSGGGQLYAGFDTGSGHDPLETIDPATGEMHEIGGSPSLSIHGLAFQPATEALFASAYDSSDPPGPEIDVIDPASGAVAGTFVRPPQGLTALAFAPAPPREVPALGGLGRVVLIAALACAGVRRRLPSRLAGAA